VQANQPEGLELLDVGLCCYKLTTKKLCVELQPLRVGDASSIILGSSYNLFPTFALLHLLCLIQVHPKPYSVLTFFTNHGFSNTQLHEMIAKAPWLLSCNPSERVLLKFQFFILKGATYSGIL